VTEQGMMSSSIVAKAVNLLSIHASRTHSDTQFASTYVDARESLDSGCRILCHIRPHDLN
jgi:hypothetical protein